MFSIEGEGHEAYLPVVRNIQNTAFYLLEVHYPRIFPLVKPHEVVFFRVECGSDDIDVVVPEANGGLVGVDPGVWGEGIADVVEISDRKGAF